MATTIYVSVSDNNTVVKEFNEKLPGAGMTELISGLASVKTQTNDFLTELVEASKVKTTAPSGTDPDPHGNPEVTSSTEEEGPEKKPRV